MNEWKSDICYRWAIQNCGLMLFRALIDRLFGTNDRPNGDESPKETTPSRVSYDKYPTLPPLLVRLLGGHLLADPSKQHHNIDLSSSVSSELVFPALDILRRAGRPTSGSTTFDRLVFEHLGSKIWNIRELAARTFCSFAPEGQYISALAELLKPYSRTSNRWHGVLLAMKFVLGKHFRYEEQSWQGVEVALDHGTWLTMSRRSDIHRFYPLTPQRPASLPQVPIRGDCIRRYCQSRDIKSSVNSKL